MEEKFVFELNFKEIITLLKGLKELPYKESAQLVQTISMEYEKQAQEKELAKKSKKEVPETK